MVKNDIGVVGLAVMGKNLAFNIADHGFNVSVYNRTPDKTEETVREYESESGSGSGNLRGFHELKEFVDSIVKPRRIILMVKAGQPVDATIDQLIPFLEKEDIIIDGGNSFFQDTIRRTEQLKEKGINFCGVGISGGEEGARRGPAIMPGGDDDVYLRIQPVLDAIAAKAGDNEPCSAYIGKDGAGHFVKMVHNGIEYADMELICEAYYILKNVLHMTPPQFHQVFSKWNEGELDSYLIEITAEIFKKIDDETGEYLIDKILDSAGQKGTGKWTSQVALDLGVSIPTITEAVFTRYISAMKAERVAASKVIELNAGDVLGVSGLSKSGLTEEDEFTESVRRALYAGKICAYAQGFRLMSEASKHFGWDLNLGRIASSFRGGCIIRARFLNKIKEAYDRNPGLDNLLLDDYFASVVKEYQPDWRHVVSLAALKGIPTPAFSSALFHFDSYRSAELPMNLLQAQRDFFGAHTYQRTDKEGIFHTEWE